MRYTYPEEARVHMYFFVSLSFTKLLTYKKRRSWQPKKHTLELGITKLYMALLQESFTRKLLTPNLCHPHSKPRSGPSDKLSGTSRSLHPRLSNGQAARVRRS